MRTRDLCLFGLSASLALGTACDWRKFDDIKERTPVQAVGPSDAFGVSDDFGRYLLPLAGPAAGTMGAAGASGATGGRFLVSAASTGAVSLVQIAADGSTSSLNNADMLFGGEEITALAEVPGGQQLLLGSHQAGSSNEGAAYVLTIGEALTVKRLAAPLADPEFGLAVGAGALAAAVASPDFVVLSASQLTVFLDGDPARPVVAPAPPVDCPLELSPSLDGRDRTNRAMLVTDLKGAGAPQIIVGTPTAGGQGAVTVFDVNPTTGEASCAFAYRNAAERFGQALAIGDFDNDGKQDLLVGAPPNGAFWIRGPLTPTSPILPVSVAKSVSSGQLGFAVGAGDVDGVPGDEALVGDPEAKVDGKVNAGEVRIVSGALLDHEQPVVRRHIPATSDAFGVQVGTMPFCVTACGPTGAGARDVLLVGSRTRVFSFFVLNQDVRVDKDPRTP